MKLSREELERLEKICEGLPKDEVRNIVSTYYKEKLNRPKINKSYSYKQENKLSNSAAILELVKGIR